MVQNAEFFAHSKRSVVHVTYELERGVGSELILRATQVA